MSIDLTQASGPVAQDSATDQLGQRSHEAGVAVALAKLAMPWMPTTSMQPIEGAEAQWKLDRGTQIVGALIAKIQPSVIEGFTLTPRSVHTSDVGPIRMTVVDVQATGGNNERRLALVHAWRPDADPDALETVTSTRLVVGSTTSFESLLTLGYRPLLVVALDGGEFEGNVLTEVRESIRCAFAPRD